MAGRWDSKEVGLEALDEQEGAGVSAVLLTGRGGMSFQAPYK